MSRTSSSGTGSWLHHLPFVLLGMRTSVREDSLCSSADLVYGSSLRLPGDLVEPSTQPTPLASDFAIRLRSVMNAACPMPVVYHGSQRSRVDPALQSASHVFLRVDAVRRPLVPPYQGPFRVLRRGTKTFDILQDNNKPVTVTVDRLKPACVLPSDCSSSETPQPVSQPLPVPEPVPRSLPVAPSPVPASASSSALDPEVWPLPTRYGRRPRPPERLNI